jgi:hypothetical protein
MAIGPGIDTKKLNYNIPDDCSFRVIVDYFVPTDGCILRIDVKIKDKQYSVGLLSSQPIKNQPGMKMTTDGPLVTPKHVLASVNTYTNKSKLLEALKELVSDLENN